VENPSQGQPGPNRSRGGSSPRLATKRYEKCGLMPSRRVKEAVGGETANRSQIQARPVVQRFSISSSKHRGFASPECFGYATRPHRGHRQERPAKHLDLLTKIFAEKIESKFSVARRERGSAAGCVTEEQRSHGGFWPILIRASSKSPLQNNHLFRQRFLARGLTGETLCRQPLKRLLRRHASVPCTLKVEGAGCARPQVHDSARSSDQTERRR